ncbi:MAG: ABC transporter permease [Victivallaceae bacterium]|nr:hypothetical protein [Victivallaceae bacterium]
MKKIFGIFIVNPVLIKEMRQYFNNRFLVIVMALMLVGELLAFLALAVGTSYDEMEVDGSGIFLANGVLLISWLAILLICGLGSLTRFRAERSQMELDYSSVTPLTPHRIVRGKLLGALAMMLFIAAMNLPFIVISYFLRGVSLPLVSLYFALIFEMGMGMTLIGLIFGAASNRRLVWLYVAGVFMGGVSMSGVMTASASISLEDEIMYTMLAIVPFLIVGYSLAVAAASGDGRDRFALFRISTLVLLALLPALAAAKTALGWSIGALFEASLIIGAMLMILYFAVSAWEQAAHPAGVLYLVPRRLTPRILRFLLSGGSWSGMLLAAPMLAMFAFSGEYGHPTHDIYALAISFSVYFLAYSLLACLIGSVIKYTPWKIWFLVVLTCFVAPLFMWTVNGEYNDFALLKFLPVGFSHPETVEFGWWIAGLLFIVSLPFIVKSFRTFRRTDYAGNASAVAGPKAAEIPEPTPAQLTVAARIRELMPGQPAAAAASEPIAAARPEAEQKAEVRELLSGRGKCHKPDCLPLLTADWWNNWALQALRRDVRHRYYWFSVLVMAIPQLLIFMLTYTGGIDMGNVEDFLWIPLIFHAVWVMGSMARNWQPFVLFGTGTTVLGHYREFAPWERVQQVFGLTVHYFVVAAFNLLLLAPVFIGMLQRTRGNGGYVVFWIVMEPLLIYGATLMLLTIKKLRLDMLVYFVTVLPAVFECGYRLLADNQFERTVYRHGYGHVLSDPIGWPVILLAFLVQLMCCVYFMLTFCGESQPDPAKQEPWRRLWQVLAMFAMVLLLPHRFMDENAYGIMHYGHYIWANLLNALGVMAMVGAAVSTVGGTPPAVWLMQPNGRKRSWWKLATGCRVSYLGIPWAMTAAVLFLAFGDKDWRFMAIAVIACAILTAILSMHPRLTESRLFLYMPLALGALTAGLLLFVSIIVSSPSPDEWDVEIYIPLTLIPCFVAMVMQFCALTTGCASGIRKGDA